MMIDKSNITGIILAGGKSSRMGEDKAFLKLNGKPFIECSIEAIKPLVSETMIVSNNPECDGFNLKRVNDIIENSGPLAGIYSGLINSKTEYNLVLSCDIPLITTEILKLLIIDVEPHVDVVQIVSYNKPMPLIALYKKRCTPQFYELLQNDERRLRIALNQCKVKNVVLDSENELLTTNVNTPEELKKIEYVGNH